MILAEMVSSYMAFNGPELALTREPRIPEYLSEGISAKTKKLSGRYQKTNGEREGRVKLYADFTDRTRKDSKRFTNLDTKFHM